MDSGREMSGSRIASLVLCRPSFTSEVVPIASAHVELSQSGGTSRPPPSDEETTRLVRQRVRTHFANEGKIELDGYELYYAVTVEYPCTLVYVCISEPGLAHRDAVDFIKSKFENIASQAQLSMLISDAGEFELQPQIQPTLLQIIKEHNAKAPAPQDLKINSLRSQVDDVRTVMAENVERIMERGERLDNIARRTEELQSSSASFKSTARRVQSHFCRQNLKWTITLVVVLLVVALIVVLVVLHKNGVI